MRVSLLLLVVVALWVSCVCASNAKRIKRQNQLTCEDIETKAITPYLSVLTSTADCVKLLTSMVNYYDLAYRQTCQMWLGGELPGHIGGAYITYCQDLTNGTTVYRAEVCCEGARQGVACFTCTDVSPSYDIYAPGYSTYNCNYLGTGIQACAADEVCMATVEYPRTGYGVYTKSCAPRDTCENLVAAADCQNGENPNCVYCCDDTYCNYHVSIRYLRVGPIGDACSSISCYYGGTCVVDDTVDVGYTCLCRAGFSGQRCLTTPCSSGPCQNNGVCHISYSRDPEYFACSCYAAYRGYACETEADLCAINICQNGGTCYDHLDYGQRCACTADWVGSDCSVPVMTSCPVEDHIFTSGRSASLTSQDCSERLATIERYRSSYVSTCKYKMDYLYRENPRHQQGVNGWVSEAHWVSMTSCQKGDHGMLYHVRYCCPACLSNPCQNGGWCQQKTDGEYVCKCRYGYGGQNCQHREAICYATGDPHYRGWDKRRVSFQSPCKYIMAESLSDTPDVPYFQVLVKHEYRGDVSTVSYVKYVELIVNGNVIRIDKGKTVTVNGLISSSGATYDDFEILDNGRFMRVTTSFGVTLESDGDWTSVVKLPDIYRNQVQGLCGSFDGNRDNDLITSDGVDVQHEENAHTTFGNSWKYEDPDDPTCQNAVSDPLMCTGDLLVQVQSNSMCGFITDTSDDNPLSKCVGNPEASAQQFFEACVYDVCANQEGAMEEVLCKSLEAFAVACRDLGYTNVWRSQDLCPLDCPDNSHYESSTSACQATCANLNAASECPLPDTENCLCDEGYVMQDSKCIPTDECGCLDESRVRYEAGHEWLSSDCTELYRCDNETYQIVSTTQEGCPEGSGCLLQDGSYQCVSLGCNVDGVLLQSGTEWQKDDCTEAYACSDGVVDVHPLNGCAANEQCTVVGKMQYECKVVSCLDAVTGLFHAIGDTWLNDDCSERYICTEDGHTASSSDHSGCSSTQSCQQQGNLYLCVEATCQDQAGQIRKVGSRWLSQDCSFFSDCTVNGIVQTVHSCQAFETCQPGDLGKCVATQGWGAWGPWSACSGGCNSGEQRRFRTCNPPGAQCPGESSESRPCQCDHQFNPEDCDKCKMVSNVLGYLPDTCDCGSFYQCEKQVDGSWKAYHRPCAPCTEWNQDDVTCTRVDDDCQANVVVNPGSINFQDDYCEANGIRYREYAADDSKFQKLVFAYWLTLPCPIGTKFSFQNCECIHDDNFQAGVQIVAPITCLSFDVGFSGSNNIYAQTQGALIRPGLILQAAYFAGNARVEVPYFNNRMNFKKFAVSLWFKRTGFSSTLQGLLTNGDCVAAASIEVLITSASTLDVTLDTDGGKAVVQGITASSDQWYHMVLTYNGERLNVYMDGQLVATNRNAGGRIQQRHCPMLIGTGGNGLEFTGYIDQMCFYNSDLDGNNVQELYLDVPNQD